MYVTMRDLVEAALATGELPHSTYDYALPQYWVDDVYARTGEYPRGFVWAYPPRSSFGVPWPITPEAVSLLNRYNALPVPA